MSFQILMKQCKNHGMMNWICECWGIFYKNKWTTIEICENIYSKTPWYTGVDFVKYNNSKFGKWLRGCWPSKYLLLLWIFFSNLGNLVLEKMTSSSADPPPLRHLSSSFGYPPSPKKVDVLFLETPKIPSMYFSHIFLQKPCIMPVWFFIWGVIAFSGCLKWGWRWSGETLLYLVI